MGISPGIPTAVAVLVQVGLYLLFRRLALPRPVKNWGSAVDAKTRKPLGGVVVRIFDKKFNKLLETQVTGNGGTYGFFVRRSVYYVTAEKSGYQTYTSVDIDLTKMDETLVDWPISLVPAK
jgi:hypothetical protein